MTLSSLRRRSGLGLVLLMTMLLLRAGFSYGEADSVKAMWVWGSDEVMAPSARERLLDFAAEKGVNRLYVGAWSALVNEPQALAKFVRTCRSRDIEVEFLFGERKWAFAGNHHRVLEIVDRVVEYSDAYPDARPLAIHLDVEPYSLPEWDKSKNSVANDLVDLYEKVRARLKGSELELVVDIPRWYDEHNIEREGKTRPLHEWIIDATDGVALMDYQDNYEKIVRGAENELRYAAKQEKTVIVGVETLCIEPTSITFCEEGREFMERILTRIDGEMDEKYSSYQGHAIHHFDSYRDL